MLLGSMFQRGSAKASCIALTSLSVAGPLVNLCRGWIGVAGSGPFTALALPAPLYHNKRPKCWNPSSKTHARVSHVSGI